MFLKIESNIDKVDSWLFVFFEYFYSWILGEWLVCSLIYENIFMKLCLVIDNMFFEYCFMEVLCFDWYEMWKRLKRGNLLKVRG